MAKKVTKKTATKKKKKTTTRKPRRATPSAKLAAPASQTRMKRPVATPAVSEEQIRMRAFEIYRAGWNPRNPEADWYQAERELRAEVSTR